MTELFGPGWGNYSIRGIVEITLPEPVSWFPQTPGWWLLLGGILLAALLALWRGLQRWRRNRYRREGLATLDRLEQRYRAGDQAVLRELAPLLRATALHAVPHRSELTGLRGDAWAQTLARLAPSLPPVPVAELEVLAYAPLDTQRGSGREALFGSVRDWISNHDNPHA